MQQLKTINWNEQSFIANGKKYFLEKELSIQRSVFAESAKIELESGLRFGKYTEDWKKIWDDEVLDKAIATMLHPEDPQI